jgi:RNA polymerase sigma-70 factor (ECF subfamily)
MQIWNIGFIYFSLELYRGMKYRRLLLSGAIQLPSLLTSRSGAESCRAGRNNFRQKFGRDSEMQMDDQFRRGKVSTLEGTDYQNCCMVTLSDHEVTDLLKAWNGGDAQALEVLTPLIYQELYRSARRAISRGRRNNSMQTTALVNELYIRMVDLKRVTWQNRAHFFAVCARLMRNILVDLFRAGRYQKRGGRAERITFDECLIVSRQVGSDLVAIDQALHTLTALDARKGQIVELRFFGGLSVKETAEVMKISPETVMRDWKFAKVWLLGELST